MPAGRCSAWCGWPRPMSAGDFSRRPSWYGRRDDGRATVCLYWLPRCVRHVRTSPSRRCATCLRRCASQRPVDVRRGIRPLSRRSLIGTAGDCASGGSGHSGQQRSSWSTQHGRQITARAGEEPTELERGGGIRSARCHRADHPAQLDWLAAIGRSELP